MKNLLDIVGQEQVIKLIANFLNNNRISHAYLFSGNKSVGKKTTALALAKAIMCKERQDFNSCDQCLNCKKIEHGNHPDLYLIETENKIKIEQVREIQEFVSLKSLDSEFSTVIIPEVERMTPEAANCLLKVLEEPPSKITFILTTNQFSIVLPTIISRCQLIRFNNLNSETIQGILRADFQYTEEDAKVFSLLANGNIEKALKIRDTWDESKEVLLPNKIIQILSQNDELEIFKMTSELEKDEYLKEMLELLLCLFRDIFVYNSTNNLDLVLDKNLVLNYQNKFDNERIKQVILDIDRTLKYLKQNVNTHLALDVLFLKIFYLLK